MALLPLLRPWNFLHPTRGGRTEYGGAVKEVFKGKAWKQLISLLSASFAWNSVTWPHVTATGTGKCGLIMCQRRGNMFGDQLASLSLSNQIKETLNLVKRL